MTKMKQKIEIINTIDINEELVILVAKKIKKEPMLCKNCPAMKDVKGIREKYCSKYQELVEPEDVCVEDGMPI